VVVCIHSSKDSPLNIVSPSLNTKFLHILPSLLSSSLSPLILILSLTPSFHLSLCRPFLRVPSGCYSVILSGDQFPGILFTCRNTVTDFLPVTSYIFFQVPTFILMMSFRTFYFFYFLAKFLQPFLR